MQFNITFHVVHKKEVLFLMPYSLTKQLLIVLVKRSEEISQAESVTTERITGLTKMHLTKYWFKCKEAKMKDQVYYDR